MEIALDLTATHMMAMVSINYMLLCCVYRLMLGLFSTVFKCYQINMHFNQIIKRIQIIHHFLAVLDFRVY